ncbi:hypothetical protein DFH94DRAFT_703253 [Russula ochroleuca]|uniref:Uncharacterized protein n=1 Tax=Russula ochroleuca TaxID=152965 RepID=A0A9P5TDV6_9AGAM|nr:hypothetical protein DFH94DRAFT_703253 [Russula ochroleuca]
MPRHLDTPIYCSVLNFSQDAKRDILFVETFISSLPIVSAEVHPTVIMPEESLQKKSDNPINPPHDARCPHGENIGSQQALSKAFTLVLPSPSEHPFVVPQRRHPSDMSAFSPESTRDIRVRICMLHLSNLPKHGMRWDSVGTVESYLHGLAVKLIKPRLEPFVSRHLYLSFSCFTSVSSSKCHALPPAQMTARCLVRPHLVPLLPPCPSSL